MKLRSALALAATALISSTAGYVLAQQAPPAAQNPGIRSKEITAVDLAAHFEAMSGRVMIMRYFVLDPHSISAEHNHKGRPEVIYVLKGKITERQQGKAVKEYGPGEAFVSNADLSVLHTLGNASDEPTEVIAVHIGTTANR